MKRTMTLAHKTELRRVQTAAEYIAVKFVKDQGKYITREITKEFKSILRQFVDFRRKTWTLLDKIAEQGKELTKTETCICMTYPVYD